VKDRGFTLMELLIVVAIISAVAAVAVPSMLRARISANETSAIASMRAINSAEVSYASAAGLSHYATSLATLATACPSTSQPFITADLASDPSIKTGYRFILAAAGGAAAGPNDCNGTATRAGYYLTGAPLYRGVNGHRALASNAAGSIFYDSSGVPPTEAAMAPGGGGKVIQ
jgi:type IV pilus assembly protein PilA